MSTPKTVDPGSVLVFPDGTDLVFTAAGDVTLADAPPAARTLTIRAATITLEPGARILAGESTGVSTATVLLEATDGDLRIEQAGSSNAEIDVVGNSPGSIDLIAAGSVFVDGVLDAHASGADGSGGSVDLTAMGGSVEIRTDIDLHGTSPDGGGGSLFVVAATGVLIDAVIDAGGNGFGGGAIDVSTSTGDVHVVQELNTRDPRYGGGGDITLTADDGDVRIDAPLETSGASAPDSGEPSCGDGGYVDITAGGAVLLNAEIDSHGGPPDCSGGVVDITAGTDFVQASGVAIDASGSGGEGSGGTLDVFAGRDATLRAVNASGDDVGGTIQAFVSGALTLTARLDARATGSDGTSGDILLDACNVTITSTGELDTRGDLVSTFLGNRIVASGQITIAGTMQAEFENRLIYRSAAPIKTGATIVPPPIEVQDVNLAPCPAIGSCGNAAPDPGEICDDGNHSSCDGCTPDCSRVDDVCGDGTRECGEQCDDGNTEAGDGCEADCTLPATSFLMKPGAPRASAGCQAEWKLFTTSGSIDAESGLPRATQKCFDGDPGCDGDLANDGSCELRLQVCLRAQDIRFPACTPASLDYVRIGTPDPTNPSNPVNQANGQAILSALADLGVKVRYGSTVLSAASPFAGLDACTETFSVSVPHAPGKTGKKNFGLFSQDVAGIKMKENPLELWCQASSSVCGDGVEEAFEGCDDGGTAACDGCSTVCQDEACGNGVQECSEQCDEGAANGEPGSLCSVSCTEAPPALRIPAGRSTRDCPFEWSMRIDDANVELDRNGLPRNSQACTDNDPTCDLDPVAGSCRLRLWACLGGADARIACAAAQVASVDVSKPKSNAVGTELAARQAITAALSGLGLPAGPGEECTGRIEVDVPVGRKGLKLKTRAQVTGSKADGDTLKLVCRAP